MFVLDGGGCCWVPVGVVGELHAGRPRGRLCRVSGPGGVDGVAVCGLSVRRDRGARNTHVSQRGSGALACRWQLEYVGRADEQVKIRGYCIELGGGPGRRRPGWMGWGRRW